MEQYLAVFGFIVTVISVCFSVYFGLKSRKKTDEKEIAARVERETRMDVKLDNIASDVKETKDTVKAIQDDIKDHEGRLAKLEASYKAEHKRLDELFTLFEPQKERRA